MIISMPNTLAKQQKFKFSDSCKEESWIHVNIFELEKINFMIITERESYFSHIIDINENEHFMVLLQQLIPSEHIYVKMTSLSVIAKLNTILKKAKFLIESKVEENNIINIKKVTELLNNIPWKFLNYRSPNEIKKIITNRCS
jgi:hypothetical protein